MAFIHTCFYIPLLLLVLNCTQDGYASNADILRNINAAVITSDGRQNGETNVEASARANRQDMVSGISCPAAEAIFPCMCTSEPGEERINLDLDCSEVENEDQLEQIMASPFPSTNFRSLTIVENANLKVLRAGILGNTTYEEFYIYWSTLEEVEAGALSGSHSTATQIVLPSNKITMFPWEELPLFTSLVTLELSDNKITPFPTLASESLQNLGLIFNPLESLPLTAFRATPSLLTISLEKARISNVIPGTFDGLAQLLEVDLSGNQLNELLTGTVQFTSTGRHYLFFQRNNISRVASSAFTGEPPPVCNKCQGSETVQLPPSIHKGDYQ
nr:oplophorus-luciferin 2-monooxygenase non-catalytic subunit-like [Cherax quadricarinatus]